MKLLRRIFTGIVVLMAVAYGGVVGYMYFNQRGLQYDAQGPVTNLADAALPGAQDVSIESGDGVVNGWYQPPQDGMPLIVYYKGNSGSFSGEHERYEQFVAEGYGFVAFDYRGFPASPGTISQDGILLDAVSVYDWAEDKGFPIMIWGRSLGSGPSTYVASVREAKALLLETPFHSAATVAAERYPLLPVGLVMQDQFPVYQWILDVEEPVMVAHGTGDRTIPVSHGERVYALAPNKGGLWIEPGADHGDLWDRGIWGRAREFFQGAVGI